MLVLVAAAAVAVAVAVGGGGCTTQTTAAALEFGIRKIEFCFLYCTYWHCSVLGSLGCIL